MRRGNIDRCRAESVPCKTRGRSGIGLSDTSNRSSLPAVLIPACATPSATPGIALNSLLPAQRTTAVLQRHRRMISQHRHLQLNAPWHCLYFFPLPQGQGSLRPTLGWARVIGWGAAGGGPLRPSRGQRNPHQHVQTPFSVSQQPRDAVVHGNSLIDR